MNPTARASSAVKRASAWGPALRGPLLVALLACVALAAVVAAGRAPMKEVASGTLTLVLMVLACLYAIRRRTHRVSLVLLRPFSTVRILAPLKGAAVWLDRVQNWRTAHLAIGVLWALALFWHIGSARGTWLETAVWVMCVLVLASGVFGAIVQFWLPRSMLGIVEREVRVQDVDARRSAIFVAAEEKILGGSDKLVDTYMAEIRPELRNDPPPIRLLEATLRRIDPGSMLRGRLWPLLEGMDSVDRQKFQDLIDLAEQKGRLDLNLYHLQLSVGWLLLHDALVVGTAALVILHLLSVAYY